MTLHNSSINSEILQRLYDTNVLFMGALISLKVVRELCWALKKYEKSVSMELSQEDEIKVQTTRALHRSEGLTVNIFFSTRNERFRSMPAFPETSCRSLMS